jgi:hypothetical protein
MSSQRPGTGFRSHPAILVLETAVVLWVLTGFVWFLHLAPGIIRLLRLSAATATGLVVVVWYVSMQVQAHRNTRRSTQVFGTWPSRK